MPRSLVRDVHVRVGERRAGVRFNALLESGLSLSTLAKLQAGVELAARIEVGKFEQLAQISVGAPLKVARFSAGTNSQPALKCGCVQGRARVAMRMLFTCRPIAGHFFPLARLAAFAKQRGHTVAFATSEPIASQVRAMGYDCFPAGLSDADSRAKLILAGIMIRDLAPDQMRPVAFGRWFSVIETPPRLADLDRICAEFRPDLLVHEIAELAAPLAAASAGLPWVTVGYGPLLQPDVATLAGDGVAPLWRDRGLPQRSCAGLYEHLYVDPCPPALQIAEIDSLPARIGLRPEAALNPSKAIGPDGAGRIYVTFGTIWNSGPIAVERLRMAVAGSASLGVEVIVTVGKENDPALLGAMPANVQVHRFIPQDQVLDQCACVVVHGGSGTMLGALAWGLPLLILPQFADQFYNAERAVRAGVALALVPSEVSVRAVTACAEKLLNDATFAACATSVRDELASMPSVEEVLDRIEERV